MKKYLLGIFAVVIALGLSSFTTVKKVETKTFDTNYYWFEVKSTHGDESTFSNSQVNYLSYGASVAQGPCGGLGYKCRIGFNSNQVEEVEPGVFQLKPNQTMAILGHYRGTE